MVNEELRESLTSSYGEELIFFDNPSYDNSIVGIDDLSERVIYDYSKMVDEFMKDEKCSLQDAIEWVEYNTIRALSYFSDPNKPIIMSSIDDIWGGNGTEEEI